MTPSGVGTGAGAGFGAGAGGGGGGGATGVGAGFEAQAAIVVTAKPIKAARNAVFVNVDILNSLTINLGGSRPPLIRCYD